MDVAEMAREALADRVVLASSKVFSVSQTAQDPAIDRAYPVKADPY